MHIDFTLIREELKQQLLNELSSKLNIPSEELVLQCLIVDTKSSSLNLKELEKKTLIKALSKASGNITLTSKFLGVSRKTVYSLIKKYSVTYINTIDN